MSIKRLGGRTGSTRVSPSPSKIPYGGFSPVRLQTRSRRRPSWKKSHLDDVQVRLNQSLWPKRACHRVGPADTLVQRPLANRPVMLSGRVHAYYGLIRATRHAERLIFFVHPALRSRVGPQFNLRVCSYMPSPLPRWTDRERVTVTSPTTLVFAISAEARHPHTRARWFSRELRNEADSGSLALRPARLPALHQQRLLLPSFRRSGRPEPTSAITTWANSHLPGPDFHRRDTQPYGLHAERAEENLRRNPRNAGIVAQ